MFEFSPLTILVFESPASVATRPQSCVMGGVVGGVVTGLVVVGIVVVVVVAVVDCLVEGWFTMPNLGKW